MSRTKRVISISWLTIRVTLLIIIMLGCYAIGAQVSGMTSGGPSQSPTATASSGGQKSVIDATSSDPAESLRMLGTIVFVCALQTLAMTWLIMRSRYFGFRLIATSGLVFFACLTIMPQIEAMFFLESHARIVRQLLIMGLFITVVFSAVAVVVLGKCRDRLPAGDSTLNSLRGDRPDGWRDWLKLVATVSIVYTLIYLVFGYYLAWRVPAIREYYGATKLAGFWQHTFSRTVLTRVVPLQLGRGVIWLLVGLVIIRSHRGPWFEKALSVAIMFSVLMNAQLLLPNPIMPPVVRHVHLIETASSNFLFGLVLVGVVWWFAGDHRASTAESTVI